MSPSSGNGINTSKGYTGSLYEGNFMWSGAMNLCWTALAETVIHEPISINTEEPDALAMADRFNHPVCSKDDLDEPSYYVKAGFGSQTLEVINRECRAKFPDKTFGDLKMDIGKYDIISYAYFFKKLQYKLPFTSGEVYFNGSRVKGFKAINNQKQTVEVLHYKSDERFIIRIKLKTPGDELLLAKGYDALNPDSVLNVLAGLSDDGVTNPGDEDQFSMPLLKLSCRREYPELMGKSLANTDFTEYKIGVMYENINFELDETGAKAESQAVIGADGAMPSKKMGRNFSLDKPFWVIMKRTDSRNPYFLLGVNNKQIMLEDLD